MKRLSLLLAVVGLMLTACENFGVEGPRLPQIEVVGGEAALSLTFPSDEVLTKTVVFKSDYDWSVTTSDEWIKVSPESGQAGTKCQVMVSLDQNDTNANRSGKVTISIEGFSIELTITQLGISGPSAIQNNEIWYTSSSNNAIMPTETDVFGANIVSNTCKNGYGVIIFDGDVKQIGENAFRGRQLLTSVTLPGSVTTIGFQAFCNCSSLTSVIIPEGVTSIGNSAFVNCWSLKNLTIPNGVTSIGNGAFGSCSSLTNITIPDSVTEIGNMAFYWCSSLSAFYGKFASGDNRCLVIDGVLHSFAIGCGAVEYIIPNNVTRIGGKAFGSCVSLTSVTIHEGVTEVGAYAFSDCDALQYVYCKPTTPPAGENVFVYRTGAILGCKIYVPTASVEMYKTADYWKSHADNIEGYNF